MAALSADDPAAGDPGLPGAFGSVWRGLRKIDKRNQSRDETWSER